MYEQISKKRRLEFMKKKKSMFSIMGILLVLSLSFGSSAGAGPVDWDPDPPKPPPTKCTKAPCPIY